jgi:hypothetical protein
MRAVEPHGGGIHGDDEVVDNTTFSSSTLPNDGWPVNCLQEFAGWSQLSAGSSSSAASDQTPSSWISRSSAGS